MSRDSQVRGRRVRRGDVAALAGVSHGTVSHVLNHPERVRPETRLKVEAAIAELGFVRDEAARHLRAGYSTTIGLLLLDAWNPSFTEIARGVEQRTADGPWSVLMSNSARDTRREQRYLQAYAERRVAGIIVVPNDQVDAQAQLPTHLGVPLIVVDRTGEGDGAMSVAVDDDLGGQLLAAHLLDLGHRRIAFVGDPQAAMPVRSRFAGFTAALESAGVSGLEVIAAPLTIEAGLEVGKQLAARPPAERPTAVAAAVDLLAFGILQALASDGVAVPGDLSVAGYDDIPFNAQLAVPLTSIARPHQLMGSIAAEMLLETLGGREPAERHVLLQPTLVCRSSTAPPRAS